MRKYLYINLSENAYLSTEKQIRERKTLGYFISAIIGSIIVANSIILFSDSHNKPSSTFLILNITAAIASSLGIIVVYRHGVHGVHGRSYLFLTLGIISWFAADLTQTSVNGCVAYAFVWGVIIPPNRDAEIFQCLIKYSATAIIVFTHSKPA